MNANYEPSTGAVRRRVIALLASIALVLVPSVAHAESTATSESSTSPTAAKKSTAYSDSDVVALFIFGTGPIATAHPAMAKKLMPNPAQGVTEAAIQDVTNQLLTVDPAFNSKVTLAIQSGDPYAAQAGIEQFRSDVAALTAQRAPGAVSPDCVVLGPVFFVVAGAVAVFIAAGAGAVVVTLYAVVNAYVPADEGTTFDLQNFSSELARTL